MAVGENTKAPNMYTFVNPRTIEKENGTEILEDIATEKFSKIDEKHKFIILRS